MPLSLETIWSGVELPAVLRRVAAVGFSVVGSSFVDNPLVPLRDFRMWSLQFRVREGEQIFPLLQEFCATRKESGRIEFKAESQGCLLAADLSRPTPKHPRSGRRRRLYLPARRPDAREMAEDLLAAVDAKLWSGEECPTHGLRPVVQLPRFLVRMAARTRPPLGTAGLLRDAQVLCGDTSKASQAKAWEASLVSHGGWTYYPHELLYGAPLPVCHPIVVDVRGLLGQSIHGDVTMRALQDSGLITDPHDETQLADVVLRVRSHRELPLRLWQSLGRYQPSEGEELPLDYLTDRLVREENQAIANEWRTLPDGNRIPLREFAVGQMKECLREDGGVWNPASAASLDDPRRPLPDLQLLLNMVRDKLGRHGAACTDEDLYRGLLQPRKPLRGSLNVGAQAVWLHRPADIDTLSAGGCVSYNLSKTPREWLRFLRLSGSKPVVPQS